METVFVCSSHYSSCTIFQTKITVNRGSRSLIGTVVCVPMPFLLKHTIAATFLSTVVPRYCIASGTGPRHAREY